MAPFDFEEAERGHEQGAASGKPVTHTFQSLRGYPPGGHLTLLRDVDAFYLEHRKCGELENRSPEDGSHVILVCSVRHGAEPGKHARAVCLIAYLK